jgi:23S rRNA pseudouridine2604 synthase
MKIRLNMYLRDKGIASRREADALIAAKKVRINGTVADLGTKVSEDDVVTVDTPSTFSHRYLLYYKPRGVATQGEQGAESVVSTWRARGLFPVGRLDKESEGLLILTNDGRLTTRLIGKDSDIEKEYEVVTKEKIRAGIPFILAKGMDTEALGKLLPAKATVTKEHTIRITLQEGKRHQIRVMLAELGLTVQSLKRIRIGSITLGRLRPGEVRELKELPDDMRL